MKDQANFASHMSVIYELMNNNNNNHKNMTKVLKSNKLLLNGIFGILKEKGDSIQDYKTWIRLTHYNESNLGLFEKRWNSPSIILDIRPQYIEPLATGVLCVGIGISATKLTALTQFWRHEWIVNAKLGTHTQNYCIDSPVVYQKPFDHITEDLLKETLKQFIGSKEQLNPPYIWTESILEPINEPKKRIVSEVKSNPLLRVKECHNIEVLSFEPPNFKLKIISDGKYSCRSLVYDLGLKLDSCAHITELHLKRMGVITDNDCLKKYEIHLNQILEAIDRYSKMCSKDLKKFEDLKTSKRRGVI